MLTTDRIKWWEPYRATRQTVAKELRDLGILSIRWWLRLVAVAACVMGAAIGASYWAFPGLQLPWPRLLLGVVVMPSFLIAALLLMAVMPLHVDVRRDRIHVAKGSASYQIKSEQVLEALIDTSGDLRRMTIRYRGRGGQERSGSFAIGEAVDVNALAMLLENLSGSGRHDPTS